MTYEIGHSTHIGKRDHQEDRFYCSEIPPINSLGATHLLAESINSINLQTFKRGSGSTFTGAVLTEDCGVVGAHLGDSPAAVVIFEPAERKIEFEILIANHTPSQEQKKMRRGEYAWFERGGQIRLKEQDVEDEAALRLNRALGDHTLYPAVSKKVDIGVHDYSAEITAGKRVFLLMASDPDKSFKKHCKHDYCRSII